MCCETFFFLLFQLIVCCNWFSGYIPTQRFVWLQPNPLGNAIFGLSTRKTPTQTATKYSRYNLLCVYYVRACVCLCAQRGCCRRRNLFICFNEVWRMKMHNHNGTAHTLTIVHKSEREKEWEYFECVSTQEIRQKTCVYSIGFCIVQNVQWTKMCVWNYAFLLCSFTVCVQIVFERILFFVLFRFRCCHLSIRSIRIRSHWWQRNYILFVQTFQFQVK